MGVTFICDRCKAEVVDADMWDYWFRTQRERYRLPMLCVDCEDKLMHLIDDFVHGRI